MQKTILSLVLILTLSIGLLIPIRAFAEGEASGFKLIHEEELTDISSTAYIYLHEKSGAELIWLKNDDPFKVFAASFKTKQENDGGAPHIVEHAVLGGSRKYKSDDIFTDLNSRSTNAFMNAMTYPDKTVFPVASRDPQDFFNLTDVYLDSVFFPMILENRKFFDREGWRYELFDRDGEIVYNGVVYNEMMGSMSDPMRNFLFSTLASIFPDTFYIHNSGGTPQAIPNLTYEEFLDFYQTYYHPSNTLLYFYGDLDIDTYLEHIDKEYLSHFDKLNKEVSYEKQKPFSARNELINYYNIDDRASEENQTYMALSYLTGDGGIPEEAFMNVVISHVLFDSTSAPVKEALREAEIGAESGSFSLSFNQNTIGVAVLNANADQKDAFIDTVESTIQKVADEGLDKENLLATINLLEMQYREANATYGLKGMDYLDLILDSYNYADSPFAYLHFTEIFDGLRAKLETNEYEDYIQERILDNPTSSITLLVPKKGLSTELEVATEAKLAEYKASLSEEELDDIIEKSINLRDQAIFPEADYYLPTLKIDEIEPNINELIYTAEELDNFTLVTVPQVTGGINYFSIQFDLSVVDVADLPYANLLSSLLGILDTANLTKGELEKEVFMYTGGIGTTVSNAKHKDSGQMDARFEVYGSSTLENVEKFLELVEEITLKSKFDDTKWIGERITAMRNGLETSASSNAAGIGVQRVRSYHDPLFAYREKLNGLDYIRFIQDLDDNFEDNSAQVLAKLEEIRSLIFNQANLIIGIAANETDFPELRSNLEKYVSRIPDIENENQKFDVPVVKLNEGIEINSDSNYVIKSFDLNNNLEEIDGSKNVLSLVLDNLYLYPELRAKGGAYGAYSIVDNYNNFVVYSYSDPNVRETINVYDNIGNFLENLDLNEEELAQIIIGYFKAYPIPGRDAANNAVYRYINGYDNDYYANEAQAVLESKLDDIKAYSSAIGKGLKEDNYLIVLGNPRKIQENADLFMNLTQIVEPKLAEPEEPVPSDLEDPILGDWILDHLAFEGEEIKASEIGMEAQVSFNQDGTVVFKIMDETSDPVLWVNQEASYHVFEEGMITEYYFEDDFLVNIEEGIYLYFLKADDIETKQTEATETTDKEINESQDDGNQAGAEAGKENLELNLNSEQELIEIRDQLDEETAAFQLVLANENQEDTYEFHDLAIVDFPAWLKNENLVLIDFWAPWCGPCKMISPEIDKLAAEFPDLVVMKINVDLADSEISNAYGVQGIPAFFLVKNGEVIEQWLGAPPDIIDLMKNSINSQLK